MQDPLILSINDVTRLTSISRTMVNRYRAEGRFPRAVTLGEKRIGFLRSEVVEWIEARVRERDQQVAA